MNKLTFYPSISCMHAIVQFVPPRYITSLYSIYNASQQGILYMSVGRTKTRQ